MAFPNITFSYTAAQAGAPLGLLAAKVAAVPLPTDVLSVLGLRLVSDNTISGPPVVRTIEVSAEPSVQATATATVGPDLAGSPITSVSVSGAGQGYILPPVALFADPSSLPLLEFLQRMLAGTLPAGTGARAQAYLNLASRATFVAAPGTNYDASTTIAFVGGMPFGSSRRAHPPELAGAMPPAGPGMLTSRTSDPPAGGTCVGSVGILKRGLHYDPTTTVAFLGTPAPGGRVAQGVPVFGASKTPGGQIVGVQITDPGAGYILAPDVIFTDPTGAGSDAEATTSMVRGTPARAHLTIVMGQIAAVTIDSPGDGYVSVPDVVIFDPTGAGSGGAVTLSMGVSRIDVLRGGSGYRSPGVVLLSAYDSNFVPALAKSNPAPAFLPLVNLMRAAIESAASTPITASIPN